MKKKRITTVLALVGAMACAFVLAGCGDDPKKMKSDEVTAAQWTEAFKADNFKNVKIESTVIDEDSYDKKDGSQEDYKMTIKSTIIIADSTQYYKSEVTVEKGSQEFKDYAKEMDFEKYSSVSNGKYTTYYTNKDGKWRQCPGEGGVADEVIEYYVGFGTKYNEFEHQDGWVKGYWMKNFPDGVSPRSYKFKKGKLAVVCTYEDDEVTTFTYGDQKLTLPTPENSSYAGTWKTHQLLVGTKTYNVGDTVEEMGDMPLAADFVTLELKNDGTFTSTNPNGSFTGVWMETDNGICYAEEIGDDMTPLELDDGSFKIEIDSTMTVVLKK